MKKILIHYHPLITNFIIISVLLALIIGYAISINKGQFVYSLDDAYIHLAVAKNFALYNIWGVTKYTFSSSVSSLLWPFLLGIWFKLFGVNEYMPLYFNIILSFLILFIVYKILKEHYISDKNIFIILLCITIGTPLPLLMIQGMEHLLQILLILLFLYFFNKYLLNIENNSNIPPHIYILGMLLVSIRYESLLIIGAASLVLFLFRQYKKGILILIVSLIPIIIYGLISLYYGYHFLPNTLISKGVNSLYWLIPAAFIKRLSLFLVSLGLIIGGYYLYYKKYIDQHFYSNILIYSVCLVSLFSGLNFRYEAYLFIWSLILLVLFIKNSKHILPVLNLNKLIIILLMLISTVTLYRALRSIKHYVYGSNNIFNQQFQMARFLNKYYNDEYVGLNDIGCVTYFTNVHLVDFVGLGSFNQNYIWYNTQNNAQDLNKLAVENNIKIIIIYDSWFRNKIPSHWIKIAEWTMPHNVICGGDTITFYSTDTKYAENIKYNLSQFELYLPAEIIVKYYYF